MINDNDIFQEDQPANDLYEMMLIGDDQVRIGVPIDAPEELKIRILGAIKSYGAGLKSVDYTIKQYGQDWRFCGPDTETQFLLDTLRSLERRVSWTVSELVSGHLRPSVYGIFAAEAAMIRLKPTFRSASLLIMQGYPFEAAAMCRIILEQCAWSYAVRHMPNREEVRSKLASKSISTLKDIFPSAGELYGLLSSYTHLGPNTASHYIRKDEKGIAIQYLLPDQANEVLFHLLQMYKLFAKVSYEVSGEYQKNRIEEDFEFIPDFQTDLKRLEAAHDILREKLGRSPK